jgi:hypothetical protein
MNNGRFWWTFFVMFQMWKQWINFNMD